MITEDYVSFEVAKLLKEKGFDESTNSQYPVHGIHYGEVGEYNITDRSRNPENYIPAPTLQMAMKWLRENYEIFIQPNIIFLYPIQYFATIFCYGDNLKTQQDVETEMFDTYEQACEEAIKYCLENLI